VKSFCEIQEKTNGDVGKCWIYKGLAVCEIIFHSDIKFHWIGVYHLRH